MKQQKQRFCALFFIFVVAFYVTKISSTSCPNGSIEIQNDCYIFQSNLSQFSTSEIACNSISGHLVSIHNGFVNSFLINEASTYFNDSSIKNFWIGLNNSVISRNWSWTDKSPFDFNEWAPLEPQNLSTTNCASLILQNGLWKSDDCFKSKPYVCKVPNLFYSTTIPQITTTKLTPTPSPSPTTNPVNINCSDGWFNFAHSCYTGYYNSRQNWTNAEKHCEDQGGFLASIHSLDEAKFIAAFAHENLWTGLFSNDNEVSWHWSDGSPVDYLPWGNGYPNLNVSSCAYIYIYFIIDYDCGNNFYFVCKKPANITRI